MNFLMIQINQVQVQINHIINTNYQTKNIVILQILVSIMITIIRLYKQMKMN